VPGASEPPQHRPGPSGCHGARTSQPVPANGCGSAGRAETWRATPAWWRRVVPDRPWCRRRATQWG